MLKTYLELSKVRITFAVTLTTITGFVLAAGEFNTNIIIPTIGIFILACGSAALNHFQEHKKDALMERTKSRPIPSGRISSQQALLFSLFLILTGSGLLLIGSGFTAFWLGLLAVLWYNGIYTYLKRITAFAVVPGSVIGSIPPMVGWVAAGGSLLDPKAGILAFFFFIWQVPHFWLLLLKYGKEYETAGFPSLTAKYSDKQIKNITFMWTLSTAIASLMIPVFQLVNSPIISIAMLIAASWLVFKFSNLISGRSTVFNPRSYFMNINYFVLSVIVFLSIDHFF